MHRPIEFDIQVKKIIHYVEKDICVVHFAL